MNFQIELKYRNVEARRFFPVTGQINVNNNSTITTVSRIDNKLSINFFFTSSYEPNIGIVRIEGEIIVSDSSENIDRAMVEWERSGRKNLPEDMAEKVHNAILANCMVESVLLSREVQLPAPIPTPHVSIGKKESTAGGSDTRSYIR